MLASLARLLRLAERRDIRQEACWIISNISAGSAPHLQAVIDGGIIPKLCALTQQCEELDVRQEAMWAISNVARASSRSQMHVIVEHGAIPALCEVLWVAEDDLFDCAVRAVGTVLLAGQTEMLANGGARNPYAGALQAGGGVDLLRHIALLQYGDRELSAYSSETARKFFGVKVTEDLVPHRVARRKTESPMSCEADLELPRPLAGDA